jgi:adenylyltransferase/sulfurtransferase
VAVVAALEATEGLKVLLGQRNALLRSLTMVDLWSGDFERAQTERSATQCSVCDGGHYELLEATQGAMTAVLCGRNAVQVAPRPARPVDLGLLAGRLADAAPVVANDYLLRFEVEGCQLTVFPDGRTIVKGTDDPVRARALYARYVGT